MFLPPPPYSWFTHTRPRLRYSPLCPSDEHNTHKRCPSSTQHLWPGNHCLEGHRTEIVRETVLSRLPPSRHYTDNRLKDIPSLCERVLFSYHGALARWASFRSGTHLRGYGAALREHRPEDAIFMFCLRLTVSHQYLLKKSLFTCLEPCFV